jgi:hypothetical protein
MGAPPEFQLDLGQTRTGPDIPETHPSFSRVLAGDDGSIWLKTPRPSERCESDDVCAWRVRSGFSVFDSVGHQLQVVELPSGFSFRVEPSLAISHVIAVVQSADGVQHVARLR